MDDIESVNGEDIEDIQHENDPVWLAANRPDEYGRGKRVRTQTNEAYLPGQMTGPDGQTYAQGTNNLGWAKLQYRGYKYKMREGVIQLNLGDVDNRPSGLGEEEVNEHILGVILIHQYNLKKGLELFGEKGELATVKELKQIHDMGTYVPFEAGKLTPEMKKGPYRLSCSLWRRGMVE